MWRVMESRGVSATSKADVTGILSPGLWDELDAAGGRDRDRTCDPYHVKVVLYR